ncbi:ATP-binding protein [Vannielia litorea]|uniref:ATP-binding protein n=1 Tax=Vannielia litorea TaxID=1217970 RepID=UPI001C96EA14|nr:ATP-binding protein [Vannielia litorea]MBY6046683.1 sodium:solute symporter [Vannielia litorea]MBY6074097.1 sodium:solute symporter [Vannielia litorea]
MSFNLLVGVSLLYVGFLFLVAFLAERRAQRGMPRWLRSPMVYTLSLSVYCTAWTFYGAVGYAARSGLEYLTIYLGPTLVLTGWWLVLRKLVRVGRTQRITSIADLISNRYGKSNALGVLVTLLAVIGTTPYIALQLQSVTLSLEVFAQSSGDVELSARNALWVAGGLALFTILFGTRNLDANERHHGVVTAIAVEAVVKLVALLAVGIFVVWGLAGGVGDMLARIDASSMADWPLVPSRWAGLTFLSAAAILCLPRMFQVLVVENSDEAHLATASWAFPLYLLLMSLFVVPIAVMGLERLPAGSNPDLFVLTLPLSEGRGGLAMLAFLGGLSSATSMVIVAAIALSTMVSNHIVMPLWLRRQQVGGAMMAGDVRAVVLTARRISIAGVLLLGYLYYRLSGGSEALAAIGLISFAGVAQALPALLGGLFWRGATRKGAMAGLVIGFVLWAWTLFLPSFGPGGPIGATVLAEGPLGLEWLRPRALFGIGGMDPLVHSLFWSIGLNTLAFLGVSLATFPGPLERLQSAQVVNVFAHTVGARGWARGSAEAEDLLMMAQRILGAQEAQALFRREAEDQGRQGQLPVITADFLGRVERELAGSVGAATAHAMVGQLAGGSSVLVEDLMRVADEAQQILEYSSQLEQKSDELARTAGQLRDANEKLTQLSIQKDAFLSQISHELRTPMTSIRSFSELLRDGGLPPEDQARFAGIIHDEAQRLTRLLNDLLDLGVMENAQVSLNLGPARLGDLIDRAVASAAPAGAGLKIHRTHAREARELVTDGDRLVQVFINLIANAAKYCDAPAPELRIEVGEEAGPEGHELTVDFIDNGSGIAERSREIIFEKFARLTDTSAAGGAGLGLAICREIMARLGGEVSYLPGHGGAAFRARLPLARRAGQAA